MKRQKPGEAFYEDKQQTETDCSHKKNGTIRHRLLSGSNQNESKLEVFLKKKITKTLYL